MKVGVTATQLGMTEKQKHQFKQRLIELGATELHHGDCVGGDKDAHQIARELNLRVVGHPPILNHKRAFCEFDETRNLLPYLERNEQIVLEVQHLLGCPKDNKEELRSGTWATIRRARRFGTPYDILWP
jgi:hypothetical protein